MLLWELKNVCEQINFYFFLICHPFLIKIREGVENIKFRQNKI